MVHYSNPSLFYGHHLGPTPNSIKSLTFIRRTVNKGTVYDHKVVTEKESSVDTRDPERKVTGYLLRSRTRPKYLVSTTIHPYSIIA